MAEAVKPGSPADFVAGKIVEADAEVESLHMQLHHAKRVMFDSDLADLRVLLRRARVNLSHWQAERYRAMSRATPATPQNWPRPA